MADLEPEGDSSDSQNRILYREFSVYDECFASASQIPYAVEQLKLTANEPAWVSFLFDTDIQSPKTDDLGVHLQFSIDGGILGFDWVLLDDRNIVDKELVIDFIQSYGHTVTEMEMNEVSYLRVEDGDLTTLGFDIATKLYQMEPDSKMLLQVDGLLPTTAFPETAFPSSKPPIELLEHGSFDLHEELGSLLMY